MEDWVHLFLLAKAVKFMMWTVANLRSLMIRNGECTCKGQQISKAIYGVFNFPEEWMLG